MVFGIVCIGLALAYWLIIGVYIWYWEKCPSWDIPDKYESKTSVTVIIPARNEAENIGQCLESILNQDYPNHLLEIIVVDDFSSDATPEIVRSYSTSNVKLIKLSDEIIESNSSSFKKKAIEIAISKSEGDFILTTDADCIVPNQWLNLMISFYESRDYKFIAAPVAFHNEQNLLEKFQSLDFMGMMGVSGAGVEGKFMNMCNGANLGYEKKAFYDVEGFKGIDKLASGDDMLLMQKVSRKFPNQIGYLKSKEAVKTAAKKTLSGFFNQRMRWASKSSAYPERKITLILGVVFFYSLLLLIGLPVAFVFFPEFSFYYFISLSMKTIADFVFLKKMSSFFGKEGMMKTFIISFFMHIVYIVIIGFLSQILKNYHWKGRKTM